MSKRRVLLVEDEAHVLKVTKLRLEHEGYEVLDAADGERAVERANAELPIHLILLDIKLPRLDGYEVCRRLKAKSSTSHIPILLFTASEAQAARLTDQCIEVGANDWIKKPFRTKELMDKIHRLIAEEEGHSHG
ncbi:MAG: response regulator [Candidatus Omnitrophica bacterium]|nr:response regulator [Candidatus Omnitrophota bacterium]